jgi:asparagine synthase (glutamine-hydrolysing)
VDQYVERVVDLTEPAANHIFNLSLEEARACVLTGSPEAVYGIHGSFALVARQGKTVRMARSLDRPMRYFLAKRSEGPVLIVAPRIDAIYEWLKSEGLDAQFHPSYTRMVPAHYVVEIQLIGCPDPDPVYTRFFNPPMASLGTDLDDIGRAYIRRRPFASPKTTRPSMWSPERWRWRSAGGFGCAIRSGSTCSTAMAATKI